MTEITMRYGEGEVRIPIDGARRLDVLAPRAVAPIADIESAFLRAVEAEAIQSPPLRELIAAGDPVTIVISDITRIWMRQDLICRLLIAYLHGTAGVPYDHITILIALGTHRKQTEEEMRRLVTPEVYSRVRVVNHDCDADDLVSVGTTSRGTHVRINPLAVGRKVILIGATVHHLMSGYGGGRKSILPGICARETIYQNHLHALASDAPHSNPAIGLGKLAGNPLHEDMVEAAALAAPTFGINLVMSDGQHHALCCGHWLHAWEKSCEMVQALSGVPVAERADIVIASCGGFPRDIELYQGTKSLLNAAQAVKPGGTILFLAECREGGGPPAFFGWLDSLRRGTLDADLRARFDVAGYIFYACCEAMAASRTYMLTRIAPQTLATMGIHAGDTLASLLDQIDFSGKTVCVMPSAGSTVPLPPVDLA